MVMKALIKLLAFIVFVSLIVSTVSCGVVVMQKDSGKHLGWNKNTNNPHNQASTNPRKAVKNSKK